MGYLVIDHTSCDPAIRREYGGLKEFDTNHCQHCERVLVKIPGKPRTRALCYACGEICPPGQGCQSQGASVCVKGSLNFRRAFDAAVQRQALFKAANL